MNRTPKPWEVEKSPNVYGHYSISGVAHEQNEHVDEGYAISDEEGDRRETEAAELDEGNRLLIQEAPILLELVEVAFDRFTDSDMQPPNHRLSTWLKKAAETFYKLNPERK